MKNPGRPRGSSWSLAGKNYFFFAGDLEAGFAAGAALGFAAGFFVAAKDRSFDYRSVASMGCAVPEPMGPRTESGPARFARSM